MNNVLRTVFAAGLLAVAGAANAQVTNGGFETGDFTGWTLVNNPGFSGVAGTVSTTAPAGGAFQAYFGPFSPGGISQAIAANAGDTVTVSFMLANNPFDSDADDSFSANLGGVSLMSVSNVGVLPYTTYSFSVVTPVANPVLTFLFYNSPDYFLLDNVSATVPTPGAAAVLGLGGLAFGRRRRA